MEGLRAGGWKSGKGLDGWDESLKAAERENVSGAMAGQKKKGNLEWSRYKKVLMEEKGDQNKVEGGEEAVLARLVRTRRVELCVWESLVKVASPWGGCAIWMKAVVWSKVYLCAGS